jgi:hypothetical protein
VINTNDELVSLANFTDGEIFERSLVIEVIAKAKLSESVDDQLDEVIKEVETKINSSVAANTLNGLVKSIVLTTIAIVFESEGEKPVGNAVMSFTATYFNQANAPDVSI